MLKQNLTKHCKWTWILSSQVHFNSSARTYGLNKYTIYKRWPNKRQKRGSKMNNQFYQFPYSISQKLPKSFKLKPHAWLMIQEQEPLWKLRFQRTEAYQFFGTGKTCQFIHFVSPFLSWEINGWITTISTFTWPGQEATRPELSSRTRRSGHHGRRAPRPRAPVRGHRFTAALLSVFRPETRNPQGIRS